MYSDQAFYAFACAGGFMVLPAKAIVYLEGEATTAQAMVSGENGRVVVGGEVVEVQKLLLDTARDALPLPP